MDTMEGNRDGIAVYSVFEWLNGKQCGGTLSRKAGNKYKKKEGLGYIPLPQELTTATIAL